MISWEGRNAEGNSAVLRRLVEKGRGVKSGSLGGEPGDTPLSDALTIAEVPFTIGKRVFS